MILHLQRGLGACNYPYRNESVLLLLSDEDVERSKRIADMRVDTLGDSEVSSSRLPELEVSYSENLGQKVPYSQRIGLLSITSTRSADEPA